MPFKDKLLEKKLRSERKEWKKIAKNTGRKRQRSTQKLYAWKAFSKFIRLRDADESGYCKCISCGKIKFWNDGMQAGHFVGGRGNAILFDEESVYAQCAECNNNSGEQWAFGQGLKIRYGFTDEKLQELRDRKHKVVKYTQLELYEIEQKYTDASIGEMMKRGLA